MTTSVMITLTYYQLTAHYLTLYSKNVCVCVCCDLELCHTGHPAWNFCKGLTFKNPRVPGPNVQRCIWGTSLCTSEFTFQEYIQLLVPYTVFIFSKRNKIFRFYMQSRERISMVCIGSDGWSVVKNKIPILNQPHAHGKMAQRHSQMTVTS